MVRSQIAQKNPLSLCAMAKEIQSGKCYLVIILTNKNQLLWRKMIVLSHTYMTDLPSLWVASSFLISFSMERKQLLLPALSFIFFS